VRLLRRSALGSFALIPFYALALVLLLAAGFLELSFNTMAQTLAQLHAPPANGPADSCRAAS